MSEVDWSAIRMRARAAREFRVTVESACITLLTPTAHETEMAAMESDVPHKPKAAMVAFKRLMLERAIVGWAGVTLAHLLADGSDDPAPFEASAIPMLLDARPAWAKTMWDELLGRIEQRNQATQAAAKNS